MNLPLEDLSNYLETTEMFGVIQEALNEDEKVIHRINNTNVVIEAFHDKDLDILWTVYLDKKILHDSVETKNLQTTIEYILKAK